MPYQSKSIGLAILIAVVVAGAQGSAQAQEDAAVAAVRKSAAQLMQQFNAGKADEVVAAFLPKGELIDETPRQQTATKRMDSMSSVSFAPGNCAKKAALISL